MANKKRIKSPRTKKVQNAPSTINNGMRDVLSFTQNPRGIGSAPDFPFPGGSEQVESVDTLFTNLRWYMVSNMRQVLSQAFVEIGLVQTIVCVPVDDALRGGILLKSKQIDEDQIKLLQLTLDRDGDLETAGWAAKWERLFGGAGILVMVDDQDPSTPLEINSITKNSEVTLRDCDMWELFQDRQNVEGFVREEEISEFYSYYNEQVHKSRVMPLKGLKAPSFVRPRLRGWGLSVVEALVRSMNQYLKATDLGFEVLDEFKLDVYKIKNLVNTLLSPNGTASVKQMIQTMNWQKNYQNAVVMDSEDDFDHKQLSFAGLAEAMEGIRMQVASDMRMPVSKLFGQAVVGGLGQSDGNDLENYNAMVESEIRQKIKYHLLRICEIKCQKLFGMIPDDLELEFKPLREESPLDQETVKTQKFTRLLQAKQAGELTTEEFRDGCNKGNLFDIQLDTTNDALNNPELGIDEDDVAGDEGEKNPGSGEEKKEVKEDDGYRTNLKVNAYGNVKSDFISTTPMHVPITTFNDWDRLKRFFNSPAFDRASYEADGGDEWIDPRRKEIFENPGTVDEGLWSKAKEASEKAFGQVKWQFVTWWYKKQGGKFT